MTVARRSHEQTWDQGSAPALPTPSILLPTTELGLQSAADLGVRAGRWGVSQDPEGFIPGAKAPFSLLSIRAAGGSELRVRASSG